MHTKVEELVAQLHAELPSIMTPAELIKNGALGKRTKVRGLLRHKQIDFFYYFNQIRITRHAVIVAVIRLYRPSTQ